MDISDVGYVVVMALWAALVVLLSYQLGYDNGRWAEIAAEKEEGRTENDGHLTPTLSPTGGEGTKKARGLVGMANRK